MRHSYGSPLRRKMRAKNDAEAVRLLRKVCMSIIVIRLSESNNKHKPCTHGVELYFI